MPRWKLAAPRMKVHQLKTWPEPFKAVREGRKPYEVRLNDRDYQVGDVLVLLEWCPKHEKFMGSTVRATVTHITQGKFGLPKDVAVLGLRIISTSDRAATHHRCRGGL